MKILVLGFSGSGKTTAAEILAKIVGGKVANDSDYIIADYAKSTGQDVDYVKKNKPALRDELFKFARAKQAEDPAYPINLEFADGANIITGTRNPDEMAVKRKLYDLVIWIDRPTCSPGSTDKLGPEYADATVVNDGTFEDLALKLKQVVRERQTI